MCAVRCMSIPVRRICRMTSESGEGGRRKGGEVLLGGKDVPGIRYTVCSLMLSRGRGRAAAAILLVIPVSIVLAPSYACACASLNGSVKSRPRRVTVGHLTSAGSDSAAWTYTQAASRMRRYTCTVASLSSVSTVRVRVSASSSLLLQYCSTVTRPTEPDDYVYPTK